MKTGYFKSLEEARAIFDIYVTFVTIQRIMYDSTNAYTGMRSAYMQHKGDRSHSFEINLGPHTLAADLTVEDEAIILNFLNRQARIFIPETEDVVVLDHVRYHTYTLKQALRYENTDSIAFQYLKEFYTNLVEDKKQKDYLSNKLKWVGARACMLHTLETYLPAVFSWLNTGEDRLKKQALIEGVENPLGMKLRTLGGYEEKTGNLEPWAKGVYTSITDWSSAFTYHLSYEEEDQKQFTLITEILEQYLDLLTNYGESIFKENNNLKIEHPWLMREAAVALNICTRPEATAWYALQEARGLPCLPDVQS